MLLIRVFEFDRTFPGSDVCSLGREGEFDNVGDGEFLEELGVLRLEYSDNRWQCISVESPVSTIVVGASGNIWSNETLDRLVVW